MSGDVVWTPTPELIEHATLTDFTRWLADRHQLAFADYQALHAWSVADLEGFWAAVHDYFGVIGSQLGARKVLSDPTMPGAQWFSGLSLNYVAQVLKYTGDRAAIIDVAEDGGPPARVISRDELAGQVRSLAATLRRLGVREGDVVAGYLPNIAEAVIAFLATAAIGATWSACGQDYSPPAAADRMAQLNPVLLIAADGYRYGGRDHDKRADVAELVTRMPSVRELILVPRLAGSPGPPSTAGKSIAWGEAVAGQGEFEVAEVEFAHPLWVLFSSGTTGNPKGIMHGHGGVLLEHLKQMALQMDVREGDVFCWYTSPSWMMWNFLVSGLLVGATIVVYDGNPVSPDPRVLWRIAEQHKVTQLGVSPAFLQSCEKAGVRPGAEFGLSALRTIGSTGSVLPSVSYHWIAEHVGDVQIASITGGTDVVSAFIGGAPIVPVRAGHLSAIGLGTAADAWDEQGRSVRDDVGELVITAPMPSMPVGFWNDDADQSRYRAAYFDVYPGVWRHGDWVTICSDGAVVVHGRSDSTLNRGGIRMGSADIYRVVEQLPEIREALVIGAEEADGGYWMPLFVVLADGAELTEDLSARIRSAIRSELSPRHVPDEVIAVRGVPHTRTGKKLEVPVKRILQGADPDRVADAKALDDGTLLDDYARIAGERGGPG